MALQNFSRHPWDTTLFIPITGACLYLLASLSAEGPGASARKTIFKYFLLGILIGYAINIQLACGAFVLTLTIILALHLWSREGFKSRGLLYFALFSLTVALAIAPYLWESWRMIQEGRVIQPGKSFERWGNLRHFWWNLMFSAVGISVWKAKHFFEPGYEEFYRFAGAVPTFFFRLDLFGWVVKASVWFFLFAGLLKIARGKVKTLSILECFACVGFAVIMLLFQYLNIPVATHYFQSFWWLSFLGIAIALARLPEKGVKIFLGLAGAVVLVNIVFVANAMSFLVANGGTRGMHHGTGAGEVRASVQSLCSVVRASGKTQAKLDTSRVYTRPNPVNFFLRRLEECSGLEISVFGYAINDADYYFVYDPESRSDARLRLMPKEGP